MMKIMITVFCVVMMSRCSSPQQKMDLINTQTDLFNQYGTPGSCNTVILKKGIFLPEYQSGLYEFMPEEGDSLTIKENMYRKGDIITAVWYLPLHEDSIKILDILSWDNSKIHY